MNVRRKSARFAQYWPAYSLNNFDDMKNEPKCFRHTNKAGKYYCSKYSIFQCNDCIACQDLIVYCSFRHICLIWEIIKLGIFEIHGEADAAESDEKDSELVNIDFLPYGSRVEVKKGTFIIEAARKGEIYINDCCCGKAVCGSCKVKIESGRVEGQDSLHISPEDKKKGLVMACKSVIVEDVTVRIPEESITRALKIIKDGSDLGIGLLNGSRFKPMVTVVPLELSLPDNNASFSIQDQTGYAIRKAGFKFNKLYIGLPVLHELSMAFRQNNLKINIALFDLGDVTEIIRVISYDLNPKNFGLSIYMGTSSIVACLVDLTIGEVVGVTCTQNYKVVNIEDISSRVICKSGDDGLKRLHEYIMRMINSLVDELLVISKVKRDNILSAVISGNRILTQLVLGFYPCKIRTEPDMLIDVRLPTIYAADIDLKIYSKAGIFIVPGNAGSAGGDILTGIIASNLENNEGTTLIIDAGAGGSIVLGNKDWILSAPCSNGYFFDGEGLRHGMRALPGAINHVEIDPETLDPSITVINDQKPSGICFSGMISLILSLFYAGILDCSGKFIDDPNIWRVREVSSEKRYILVWKRGSAQGEEIFISESEIAYILQCKSEIYGGIMTLLRRRDITVGMVDRFLIAGEFGRSGNPEMAIELGMLPDVQHDKFEYIGNSSIRGVFLALVSEDVRNKIIDVSDKMDCIDFSSSSIFFDECQGGFFIPHKDISLFPSVENKLIGKGVHGEINS